ncbi:MAG TPA: metallophosphoesterase [Flavobacteriales bacterium]|nr:metallophosphoesterase [Flavobacteriales bacterium]HMU13688.1 metallophosphoesterase [Flavobacteriales bacterium]HNI04283.1 metallophosphoesterase [Flavobacteriales bacterium]
MTGPMYPGWGPEARRGLWSVLGCACLSFLTCDAPAQRSSFNNREVVPPDGTGHYRILIGGHFHGTSNNRSGYPAATLLANLDTINALAANVFVCTGDLFMDPVNDRPRYVRALFSKLNMPLFNAPGNHDAPAVEDPRTTLLDIPFNVGDSGATRSDRVLILDTEQDNGSFTGDQLGMLEELRDVPGLRNVFIFSHRPVWAEDDQRYDGLFKDNTRSLTGTNFRKDVYPLLEKLAEQARIYWISGSLGGGAPSSIFFQRHAPGITFIQCAIRDEPRDALLYADVFPDKVEWSALSLTGQGLLAPEAYDADWWHAHAGKKPDTNWRLLPYLVKTTVMRKEFWWGALAGMLVLLLVRRTCRR